MPRDSSGNYTLPPGNPVVTDTVIESVWANTTMSDIATQLNGVVTRDGLLGPTAPLKLQNGTVAAPGLAFNAAAGTGMFRTSTKVGFTWLGSEKFSYNATGVTVNNNFVVNGEVYTKQFYVLDPTATYGIFMSYDTIRQSGYLVGQDSLDFYSNIAQVTPTLVLENEKAFFGLPNDFAGAAQVNVKGDVIVMNLAGTEGVAIGQDPAPSPTGGYLQGIPNLNLYSVFNDTVPLIELRSNGIGYYRQEPIGWGNMPPASGLTPTAEDAGKTIYATGTVNLNNGVFAANDTIYIVNNTGASITVNGPTNFWSAGTATNGAKTLTQHNFAQVVFISPTEAIFK